MLACLDGQGKQESVAVVVKSQRGNLLTRYGGSYILFKDGLPQLGLPSAYWLPQSLPGMWLEVKPIHETLQGFLDVIYSLVIRDP